MKSKFKNNRKVAGGIAILANLIIICVEVLVLLKIVPYDIIGGGRMQSYEKAAMLAGFSILVQLILLYCIAAAANILSNKRFQKITGMVLEVFSVYFVLNIVMNLMGKTWFERVFCSLICLVQVVCFRVIVHSQKGLGRSLEQEE